MDSTHASSSWRKLIAFTLPMAVFILLLGAPGVLRNAGGSIWQSAPEYWIYPLQTIVCGTLLLWFWRDYEFSAPRQFALTLLIGGAVFALWIAPQQFLGFEARRVGFDVDVFRGQPALYWGTVSLRFLRLVVVVPLIEEIFWRGFLLRYLINERFSAVPFGAFSWVSFMIVTLAFGFSHSRADWVAGIVTGALYNIVAHRSKSLASCVIAHATTNLLLGAWIMATRQWGFW